MNVNDTNADLIFLHESIKLVQVKTDVSDANADLNWFYMIVSSLYKSTQMLVMFKSWKWASVMLVHTFQWKSSLKPFLFINKLFKTATTEFNYQFFSLLKLWRRILYYWLIGPYAQLRIYLAVACIVLFLAIWYAQLSYSLRSQGTAWAEWRKFNIEEIGQIYWHLALQLGLPCTT